MLTLINLLQLIAKLLFQMTLVKSLHYIKSQIHIKHYIDFNINNKVAKLNKFKFQALAG